MRTRRRFTPDPSECIRPLLASLKGHKGPIRGLAWSPDGKRIVAASGTRTLQIWDLDHQLPRFEGTIPFWSTSLAWSPDGRFVACGTDQGVLTINVVPSL